MDYPITRKAEIYGAIAGAVLHNHAETAASVIAAFPTSGASCTIEDVQECLETGVSRTVLAAGYRDLYGSNDTYEQIMGINVLPKLHRKLEPDFPIYFWEAENPYLEVLPDIDLGQGHVMHGRRTIPVVFYSSTNENEIVREWIRHPDRFKFIYQGESLKDGVWLRRIAQ